jgi:predicted tellurium resistance membrane protein TerC
MDLLDANVWIAFVMLTALEVVLGIDNIVFLTILVGHLPPESQTRRAASACCSPWARGCCSCCPSAG